jgi:hypothetical protein
MRDRLRAIRVVLGCSFRADARRATAVLLLQVAAAANTTLTGVWVKQLTDGATSGDASRMAVGALGLAVFVFVEVLIQAGVVRTTMVLREKTVHLMETELLGAVAQRQDQRSVPAW